MSNENVYLPGKIRDRIQDLMKANKVTQAELAARIGCSESMLSRFISGKTDKLGDENIIRIARVFNVSTDFLLGEVDVPDRLNYDISELGLSVQAARKRSPVTAMCWPQSTRVTTLSRRSLPSFCSFIGICTSSAARPSAAVSRTPIM